MTPKSIKKLVKMKCLMNDEQETFVYFIRNESVDFFNSH